MISLQKIVSGHDSNSPERQNFFISSASVQEISQTSYVPSLPPNLGITETAKRIIDREKQLEWQRIVDLKG